ncbi:MAG: DUF3040 domain-containing protein [Actinomycetota bacterium]|nr:DUF3040 domain-containing protein [Actinomycetota bacterium]
MSLSEREQRTLDQIERDLTDDPSLSVAMARRPSRRPLWTAAAGCALGLVMLIAGAILAPAALPIGVALSATGFVTMSCTTYLMLSDSVGTVAERLAGGWRR